MAPQTASTSIPRTVELRHLNGRDLEPLLCEEAGEWERKLDWDFSKSAALVRRLANARELGGVALVDQGEVAGYAYCGLVDQKGQIWDVYVRPNWRKTNAEEVLFRVLLDALMAAPGVRRIESQLMLMHAALANSLKLEPGMRVFERILMKLDTNAPVPPAEASTSARFHLEPWDDRHHDAAAAVLTLAHAGHIDAEMSDQYRTFAGASRFLRDLVQFPGCATFCRPASFVAFDEATGKAAGISLVSFVGSRVAHVAELCVAPECRGAGLGNKLLRQSAAALADAGAERISITVTATNESALRLYTRFGFGESRRFYAYAWEKP
ncbi:MAG TPA: N-acetyltransferase [Bryobacteraceae bacterium]|nr:N-acetyltransferase [Bryobacteraceae bacterium]